MTVLLRQSRFGGYLTAIRRTSNAVELVPRQVEGLQMQQLSEGGQRRQPVPSRSQVADAAWQAAQVRELVVIADESAFETSLSTGGEDSQLNVLKAGQELLKPRHTVHPLVAEIDGCQVFPVRHEWLDIGDDLDKAIMRDAE